MCKRFLFFLLPLIGLWSCGEEPELRLTATERVRVDTIYTRRVDLLRPGLDSICETNFDQWVHEAVDSLITIRKEEEARLRARMLKKE